MANLWASLTQALLGPSNFMSHLRMNKVIWWDPQVTSPLMWSSNFSDLLALSHLSSNHLHSFDTLIFHFLPGHI